MPSMTFAERARGTDLLAPPYAEGAEADLPRLLVPLLPPAGTEEVQGRDVVIILDGVGAELLAEHLAIAPALRSLRADTTTITTVGPSTTAAAITSLTTSLAPLAHGTIGYRVHDPGTGQAVQQLSGAPGIDARRWMPRPGLAELSARTAVQVGRAAHADSFLTRAAYRGWDFVGHRRRDEQIEAALAGVRRAGAHGLTLVHVADVDHAGHQEGTASDAWRDALADADALIQALLRRLPTGTRVTITADHGMVDTAPATTIDLAQMPEIDELIETEAGESRLLSLRSRRPELLAERLRERLGGAAVVLTRPELLAAGIMGPPAGAEGEGIEERVLERLGDVTVAATGRFAPTHARLRPPSKHPEVGVHGSLTARELLIPLARVEA